MVDSRDTQLILVLKYWGCSTCMDMFIHTKRLDYVVKTNHNNEDHHKSKFQHTGRCSANTIHSQRHHELNDGMDDNVCEYRVNDIVSTEKLYRLAPILCQAQLNE